MHRYVPAQTCSKCCSDVPCLVTALNNRKLPRFKTLKDLEMWGYSGKHGLFLTPLVPARAHDVVPSQ